MEKIETNIPDVFILEPKVFGDSRGFFLESFNQQVFERLVGYPVNFVQDNESHSMKGVLRGLHFQKPPKAQGKLVRVNKGSVLDVAVDIRKNSPTYGQHVAVVLSDINKRQLWIPPGFAHGFLTLEDDTRFLYKCTDFYAPELEETIMWNDKRISIDWGEDQVILSGKDQNGVIFDTFASPFEYVG